MYAILGGLGEQGRAILRYLLLNTTDTIVTNDLHGKAIPPDMEEMGKRLDPDGSRWIHTAGMFLVGLQRGGFENGVVISCIDPSMNADLAWRCVSNGWHYLDLGGDTAVSRIILDYGEIAAKKGIVLASECGLAPGIVSSMAAERIRRPARNGRLLALEQYCGGIPLHPEPPMSYCRSFSGKGLWREYTGAAEPRIDHRVVKRAALSGRQYVFIPGLGVLEAFFTSGGQGTAPAVLNVPRYVYKTLRYPGHLDFVLDIVSHQDDPGAFLEGLLPRVSPEDPDIIVLMERTVYLCASDVVEHKEVAFWQYDAENKVSAMAQATGYSAGALATMIHDGLIAPGGLPMHHVEWSEWKKRIEMMPDQFLPAV